MTVSQGNGPGHGVHLAAGSRVKMNNSNLTFSQLWLTPVAVFHPGLYFSEGDSGSCGCVGLNKTMTAIPKSSWIITSVALV